MRLRRILPVFATVATLAVVLVFAPALRAEYVVLRNGQRITVTSYEILDGKYRLQMMGGSVEIATQEIVSIEPEEVFTSNAPRPVAKAPYTELVAAAAARYSVDADLISSVIAAESNFNPKAISRRNARGLMQLLPQTATLMGVHKIFDPQENIDGGTRYLRDLLRRYNNDVVLTLAAYNAGPERVQQYGRVPPYAETISYVRRVKKVYDKRKRDGASKIAQTTRAMARPGTSGL